MRRAGGAPAPHHRGLAALVRFRWPRLPELCSCVTNQRCASGCAIVSSALKRIRKPVRASLHRPLCSPRITIPMRPRSHRLQEYEPNQKLLNRRLKRGPRPTFSLIGTTLRKRAPSQHEPRVRMAAPTRVADGGGEEVDEAEAGRRQTSLCCPAEKLGMAKWPRLQRAKHRVLQPRRPQRRRALRRVP
jgi:hypothetical protein